MSIADKLTLLAASKEMVRLKLGISEDVPFSEYGDHVGWDGITSALGQSTTTAASQKLVTDEVDKTKAREDLLQTSIAAILGINKKLTNRINALEESNISSLFNNGASNGIWLDPSDLKTMFQNANGAPLPVTKDGDPVGLILDKSQGLEKEFLKVTLKDLRGWLLESEGVYKANKSGDAAGSLLLGTDSPIVVGRYYTVTFNVSDYLSGYAKVFNPFDSGLSVIVNGNGSYTFSGIAKSTAFTLLSVSGDLTVSDIVIAEIKGNHASQLLAASRPTYRTDGVLHWLQFDGVDDSLKISNLAAIPQPFNISIAKNETHKATVNYLTSSTGSLVRYATSYWTLSFGAGHSNILLPALTHSSGGKILTTKVNGASSTITSDGKPQNITSGVVAMSGDVTIFSNDLNFVQGDLYSLIVSKSPNNNSAENYLANKMGVEI